MAGECHGHCERCVAADERTAIAGPITLSAEQIEERDARSERDVPRIAREKRAGGGVDLGDHERMRRRPRGPEHPLHIGRHADMAGAAGAVVQHQARNFDRVRDRHILQQIGGDLVRLMCEAAVAPAVANHKASRRVADR